MEKIKISILCGFLGSGKTTLLKQLLTHTTAKHPIVLMNEFGEVSIDHFLLPTTVTVQEINNGCVCCSSKDEFCQQLEQIAKTKKWDHVYIECSGNALPFEIIDLLSDPQYVPYFTLETVYGVLDAPYFLTIKKENEEQYQFMLQQIAYATRLLITKSEQLSADDLLTLSEELGFLGFSQKEIAYDFSELEKKQEKELPAENLFYQSHSHLHLQSFVYHFQHPIDQNAFVSLIEAISPSLLRMKGFIYFTQQPEQCYVLQSVHGNLWLEPYVEDAPANIVFIGQNLPVEKLKEQCNFLENRW
ncbi:CobW family GTP-binding protein [Catellicoccus marimammalium]|uniref:Putative metal chaperone involved in Zn homeostasis n=1 Tax=Catellicoccus marimammalium M35/04/3 TaxID=1234409 RepID=K8Z9H6_9ENTE|nr:GTP-binding protein [Catellicoccus marimammalium]EKU27684.1 Putative metal chaperone involved in Zn homeostasis [Catellicoccus marimammalium M35/04/3]